MATVTPSSNPRTPNQTDHIKTTPSTTAHPYPMDVLNGGGHGGGAGSSQPYLGPPGCEYPGDMMIDRCDVGSHVVSESVEGGWLMPGT
jgi:hypothetical protein